jgi:cell wall-associated NlpC family hydrolase
MKTKTPRKVKLKRMVIIPAVLALFSILMAAVPVARASADVSGLDSSSGSPRKTWYLPDSATAGGFETWVMLENPGSEEATVSLAFHTSGGEAGALSAQVQASSMACVNVGGQVESFDVAVALKSDQAVYAWTRVKNPARGLDRASPGTARTGSSWRFTGGSTAGEGCETWVLLHNPSKRPARVNVAFSSDLGAPAGTALEIKGQSRLSVNAGAYITGFDINTTVESDRPIAAAAAYGKPGPKDSKEKVVALAHMQLGKPYVSAGSGPSSFDCSGLTQYCYGTAAGVALPHSSYAQARCGTPVTPGELKPGDIVGFHGWGHVGIYIGQGQYIHAPHSGDVVRISSLSERNDLSGAVRIL